MFYIDILTQEIKAVFIQNFELEGWEKIKTTASF